MEIKLTDRTLEISDKFDEDIELEITILTPNGDCSVWITKEQVKRLVGHLVNVL